MVKKKKGGKTTKKKTFKEKVLQSSYLASLKGLWSKRTILFGAVDLGLLLVTVGIFILSAVIFKTGQADFMMLSPVFGDLANELSTQSSKASGADLTAATQQLEVAKKATYGLLRTVAASVVLFLILFIAALSGANMFIWSKIKKLKISGKMFAKFYGMTAIVLLGWSVAYLLLVLITRNPYVLAAALFLWFILIPYSINLTYSLASKRFRTWFKDTYTKPFKKAQHYALALLLFILTFVFVTNTGNLVLRILPKVIFEKIFGPIMLIIFFLAITWGRLYIHNLNNKLWYTK